MIIIVVFLQTTARTIVREVLSLPDFYLLCKGWLKAPTSWDTGPGLTNDPSHCKQGSRVDEFFVGDRKLNGF